MVVVLPGSICTTVGAPDSDRAIKSLGSGHRSLSAIPASAERGGAAGRTTAMAGAPARVPLSVSLRRVTRRRKRRTV
jgi:hypothetical protein